MVIEQPKLLDREHDNLRAALRWSCAHDPVSALRLVASLWRFWFLRGHAVEGARWVERALAVAPEPTRPRAAALIGLTGLDSRQGRADRHRALGAEAMAIVRQIGEPDEVVMARIVETALAWSTFDLDEAEQMAAEVRAEAIERGRPEHAAAGSWLLGQCALSREDGPLAAGRFDRCLAELAQADPSTPPFLPVVTPSIQLVPHRRAPGALRRGDLAAGAAGRRRPGRRVRAVRDRLRGPATRLIRSRRSPRSETRSSSSPSWGTTWLGRRPCTSSAASTATAATSGRPARPCPRPGTSALGLGDRRGELLTEINVALLHAMAGDIDRGLAEARRCLSGFESAGDQVGMGATSTVLGAVELLSGETRAAREMYARAAEKLAPWRRHAGWQRLMVAELSVRVGRSRTERRGRSRPRPQRSSTEPGASSPMQRLAALRGRDRAGVRWLSDRVEVALSSRLRSAS